MDRIDIVVPVKNEAKNVEELLQRIDRVLRAKNTDYTVTFVDNLSTDRTVSKLNLLKKKYPIHISRSKKKANHAQLIRQGIAQTSSEYVAVIEANLQYPPEALPEMLEVTKEHGVVVANRNKLGVSFIRKIGSKVNSVFFDRLLFGLKCDVQSGLKVFRRELAEQLDESGNSKWLFDKPLLLAALDMGYTIGTVEVEFDSRKRKQSKIKTVLTAAHAGGASIKLRAKRKRIFTIRGERGYVGAGVMHKRKKYITHSELPHELSALYTLSGSQKIGIIAIFALLVSGIILNVHTTALIAIGMLTTIYFLDLVFSAYVLLKSLHFPPEVTFEEKDLSAIVDNDLPKYTVLCPLYKESNVLPEFIRNIDSLDWPKDKLEVLLLLEEDDSETIKAAEKLVMPDYVQTLVVPDSQPKTKPKACNYGLAHATGEYVVIYDAEDRPDPLQLKKAFLAFNRLGNKYACVQSKLNYFNSSHNFLTRLFTAEYSLWFDIILPGLQSIESSIPLGGTSNHFRTNELCKLNAWDPFNVTEDCDLGVRIFKSGLKTAIIDSVTLEEANSKPKNWIRQRSRWIKGYFQTYLVHMRNPIQFFRKQGIHAILFQLIIGMRMTFMLINPILWVTTIAYFTAYSIVGPTIESLYPPVIFYFGAVCLIFGNFMYIYNYMIGCAKRGHFGLIKYVFLIPFYWLMTSIAAFMAFYQLIVKPHYWEKTLHGLTTTGNEPTAKEKKAMKRNLWRNETKLNFTTQINLVRSLSKYNITGASMLIIATGLGNVFGFLYNAYLGRNLDTIEFGTVALIGSLISLITLPVGALASTVAYRTSYLIGKFGGTAQRFWVYIRSKTMFIAVVISLLWTVLSPVMASVFRSEDVLPFIISAPIWLMSFAAAVDRGFLSANFSFKTLAFVVLAEALLKYLVAIVIVQLGLTNLVYAAIPLSMIIPFLIAWRKASRIKSSKIATYAELDYFPKKFFWTNLLKGLSSIGFLSFDIVLAKYYLDPQSAGYYTLLSLMGKMIYFVGQLFSQFTYPVVSRAEGAGKDTLKSFLPLFLLSTLATIASFVLLGLFGGVTTPLILGERGLPILPYIGIYALSLTIYTITSLIVDYHQILRRYIFSVVGFMFALLQILVLSLFHRNLGMFVDAIFVLSVVYLVVTILMHVFYSYVQVFIKNMHDFFDLVNFKLNGKKPLEKGYLRILIYNWRDIKHEWAGGAEVYVHELAKNWVREGHKVTVFCGNDGINKRNEVIDGVRIVRRGGFYTVYLWAFLYYIFRFRRRYDVVVESENGIPFFTPLYSTKPKILIIHHVHQEVFQKHLSFPFSWIARFIESKLTPFVYNNQKIVAVSESTKRDIVKMHIAKEENITIVNPGIDASTFHTSQKTKEPSFIYLGRHKAYKNIDIAIKAFSKLLVDYPKAKLIIAGNGEITWDLKRLVSEMKMSKSVRFVGKVSHEEKVMYLGQSWAAIQPSSFEGWGITVIEANACGTLVIASNVNGLKDSVLENKTGILVPKKNVDALTGAMQKVISNSKKRDKLSREAVVWSKKFDWEISALRFMDIVKSKANRIKINGINTAVSQK